MPEGIGYRRKRMKGPKKRKLEGYTGPGKKFGAMAGGMRFPGLKKLAGRMRQRRRRRMSGQKA